MAAGRCAARSSDRRPSNMSQAANRSFVWAFRNNFHMSIRSFVWAFRNGSAFVTETWAKKIFAPGGRGNAFPTLPHAPKCICDVPITFLVKLLSRP